MDFKTLTIRRVRDVFKTFPPERGAAIAALTLTNAEGETLLHVSDHHEIKQILAEAEGQEDRLLGRLYQWYLEGLPDPRPAQQPVPGSPQ